MTIRKDGETMRATAERAIRENCGEKVKFRVLGNAPWAYYKRSYPKKVQAQLGHNGEKVWIVTQIYDRPSFLHSSRQSDQ